MLQCYFVARVSPGIERLPYPTLSAAPLEFVRHGELLAVARRVAAGSRSTPELMLEYNAVLAAASRRATVLPCPFGLRFRSESGLLRLLRGRSRELIAALDRLEGKAEMILRVRLAGQDSPDKKTGEIEAAYRPLDSRFQVGADARGQTILEITHLVEQREAALYRQRLSGEDIEITGPWPPRHFLPQFLRMPPRAERRPARVRRAAAG